MKDFIEKLIARLEEEVEYQHEKADSDNGAKKVSLKNARNKMGDCYKHAIEIVNQLAEEMGVAKNAITNADRIRSMNDMELADFLEQFEVCSHCEYMDKERCTFENPCTHGFATAMALKWLQSEADVPKGDNDDHSKNA